MIYLVFIVGLVVIYILVYGRYKKTLISVFFDPVELDSKVQGELRVVTYNIAGLPQIISSARTPRKDSIHCIGKKLNTFDIVNVQEDFNYNSDLFAGNVLPYRTLHKGKVPLGDGLNTLSSLPIIEYHRIPWQHCSGSDCLTPKGFSYAKILLADQVSIDVYNVHANSNDSEKAALARRNNLLQLAQYIHDHSADRPLLVMGDFNAHYAFKLDNLPIFLKKTNLVDAWVSFCRNNSFPAVNPNFVAQDMLTLTREEESLDKILFRNSAEVSFYPTYYQVDKDIFVNAAEEPLSDHLAVIMSFKWEYKEENHNPSNSSSI
ncbi:endonuclease/exonuclease/phosphatase family protein [Sphingobacterium sp. Mn56C]|uniref:endonuclease/exonuclease/phosphatase family protein n=1 Tax=Sphingobacterium sp. Mn56C TaxID=3395261 RepID=UPI003BCFDBA2